MLFGRFAQLSLYVLAVAAKPAVADVPVHVNVACGAACEDSAYVALVPADSPMRKPADEAVTVGGVAELAVPPGPYLLVAVARGHRLTVEPQRITGPTAQRISLHLEKTVALTGTVVAEDGRPIANATVARGGLDAPEALLELSAAGTSALRQNASTRTDAVGRWWLEAPGRTKIPLTVHAPGYATAFLSLERADADEPILPPVTLHKASRLTVEVDRTDEEIVIIPRPRAATPIATDWLDRTHAKTAGTLTLEWPSLAAGIYDLLVVNTNPLKFQKPHNVTSVRLESAGAAAHVKVTLPQPRDAKASYVKVLLPRATDTRSLKAYAETSADEAPAEIGHSEEEAVGGRNVYLDTTSAPERTYLTTSHEILLPRGGRRAGTAAGVQRLQRGTISFRLVSPAGTKLPEAVSAAFSGCTKDEPSRPMGFGVANNGAVELAVPVGCRAAALEVTGFAPLATTFTVKPMEKRALGEFRLSRAASAEVQVVRQPSGAIADDVVVRAILKRGAEFIPLQPVKTNALGIANVGGLPPGEDVILETYKEGSLLKTSTLVRLDPGQTIVQRLEIPEPGSLSITARLDDDLLLSFPSASLFALRLQRKQTDEMQPPDTRDVRLQDSKTVVPLSDLSPGSWGVQLLVRVDGVVQTIEVDPVEVQSGRHEEIDRIAKPTIIEGVVLLRQQGIEAFIDVGDWPAGPASLVRAYASKGDGSFRLVLPGEGTYDISVRKKVPDNSPKIPLGAKALTSGRKLELSLPPNGVVVTTMFGDQPAANTQVTLKRRNYAEDGAVSQLTLRGRTNTEGDAFFESVLEGPWVVEASAGPEQPVTQSQITVHSAVEVVPIILHLDESARLEGRVFTAAGTPARNGTVECVYVAADQVVRTAWSPIHRDGTYTIKFARPAPENLSCGATTADGAILPFRAGPGRSFDVYLPPETGSLRIGDYGSMVVANRFWLISDDQVFDLTWAARAMGSRWTPLVLSRVPAGRWRLVRALSPDLLSIVQFRRGIDVVSDLQIAQGGSYETTVLPPGVSR